MRVRDIMTTDVGCCTADASLNEVATVMVDYDCGEVPVCDDARRPIGVVTDRDIVCRIVAKDEDARRCTAGDIMSTPVVTATLDMAVEDCARLMEQYRIRRIPVVDAAGICRGIVAQADLARKSTHELTAEVVGTVSQPSPYASS